MRKLETEEIIVLDKIIEKLDETNLDRNAILEICGGGKIAETVCGILEDDGWIGVVRVGMNTPSYIWKSDSFRMLLAKIGNYAEQAKIKEQRFQQVVINTTSSNIAVGNTSSVNQTNKTTNSLSDKKSLIGIIVTIVTIMAGISTILAYYK